VDLAERLRELNCDPQQIMALIATNMLPCGVCRGSGKTKYIRQPGRDAQTCPQCRGVERGCANCAEVGFLPALAPIVGERLCESCYGSLLEKCDPKLRGEMSSRLMEYLLPKRKAVEHTGLDGGPIQSRHEIVFVK
jgi:hypothetical protein